MPTVLATWTSSLTAMRTRRDITQVCILSCLARAFPGDKFIAEETGGELLAAGSGTRAAVMDAVGRHSALRLSETDALGALDLGRTGAVDGWSSSGRTWVLDPVDGTKGFLRGDQFAVALSLLDGGVPVLGMLGCPALGDAGSLFWAERGHGASCERQPPHDVRRRHTKHSTTTISADLAAEWTAPVSPRSAVSCRDGCVTFPGDLLMTRHAAARTKTLERPTSMSTMPQLPRSAARYARPAGRRQLFFHRPPAENTTPPTGQARKKTAHVTRRSPSSRGSRRRRPRCRATSRTGCPG